MSNLKRLGLTLVCLSVLTGCYPSLWKTAVPYVPETIPTTSPETARKDFLNLMNRMSLSRDGVRSKYFEILQHSATDIQRTETRLTYYGENSELTTTPHRIVAYIDVSHGATLTFYSAEPSGPPRKVLYKVKAEGVTICAGATIQEKATDFPWHITQHDREHIFRPCISKYISVSSDDPDEVLRYAAQLIALFPHLAVKEQ